ncbi:MAG: glycosyltransferase [Ferruginibacter sp.]|nr:glycosyltransferase [Ferruginibacter sp.]
MKALLINRIHFAEGGADKIYLNTGNLLQEHNIEVAYFSSKNEHNLNSSYSQYFIENIAPRNITIKGKIRLSRKYLYNTEASKNLSDLITDFKPDVAHIHLFYGVLSASILKTLKKHKIPIVITIHDYRLLCPASTMLDKNGVVCEKCKSNRFYNCTLKRCSGGNVFYSAILSAEAYMREFVIDPLKFIDHFIFSSQFSLEKHISFDNRYSNKSSQLYNFAVSTTYNFLEKGGYLLYYGRLSREKGIMNLINAAKKRNVKLKIVGTGPQEEEIKDIIQGFTNIECTGFKAGSELNELIANCSFVVVPSEWYENNPMTIVEAFSLGKPVIGSKIGGIPELVNNDTGVIFEPGNVLSLANAIDLAENMDINEYKRISNNCLDFARVNFSKDTHFQTLNRLYNSVINEYQNTAEQVN